MNKTETCMNQQTINTSVDVAKGGLILLVVIGHFLLGTLDDNFVRYYIYSFHMPMFIFISGFLIKRENYFLVLIKHLLPTMPNECWAGGLWHGVSIQG